MAENKANKLQFAEDCTVIEMKHEYSDYTGDEKYGIITGLSEAELEAKYGSLLDKYRPFIVLDLAFAEVRDEYRRNEKKHQMRMYRGHIFDIDDDFEVHHPDCSTPDCVEQLIKDEEDERLWRAIKMLKPIQQQRLIRHFFMGESSRSIAKEEGVNYSKIDKSIASALSDLKKFLS